MTTRTERMDAIEERIDTWAESLQETDEIAADLAEDFSDLQERVDALETPDTDSSEPTGGVTSAG